jgi:hypothetical protein
MTINNSIVKFDKRDEESVVKFLTDIFAFRKGILLLGLKNQGFVFCIDIAINGSEGKEKMKLGEFLGEIRESDIPDTVSVSYKDPWKAHASYAAKSVLLIETAEAHWKYRIYFVDMDSYIHQIISKESEDVYYKLLLLKASHFEKIIDRYYPRDTDMISLEQNLKKKFVKKMKQKYA